MKKIKLHYQRTIKRLSLFILAGLLSCCSGPSPRHEIVAPLPVNSSDIITLREIPQSHKRFIARFLPEIHTANNKILGQRNAILDLRDNIKADGAPNKRQLETLNAYLKEYRLEPLVAGEVTNAEEIENSIARLLKRVDIIPVRLVMAQAIIESGWGSSGFAREGNNYFGVHCYTEGCGIKPAGTDSATFYVKVYPDEMSGIEDYLWILNTGYAYRGLRDARLQFREEKEPVDPLALARELTKYSVKGEGYVDMVSNIMRNYLPRNIDELLTGKKP